MDWESVRTKYDDISTLVRQELPDTLEEARENSWMKDYAHTKEDITKKILTAKLKAIRIKFQEAVDPGPKIRHGRVVLLYYELCEKIWGGSPATVEIETGSESTEIDVLTPVNSPQHATTPTSITPTSGDDTTDDYDPPPNDGCDDAGRNSDTVRNKRRELLDSKLGTYKHECMKRKLPLDSQLLSCAQEELALKKTNGGSNGSF